MKIVRVQDIIGSEREVSGPGWTSRRMLLKKDGMGFSFHETIIPAGAELNLWYKHHLEAVYCVAGNGSIYDKATLRGGTEDMRLICAFNPPVTGREVHDEDGAYIADTGDN